MNWAPPRLGVILALMKHRRTPLVQPLDPLQTQTQFTVRWSGSDARSGLNTYDLQYLDQADGIWRFWLTNTTITAAIFSAQDGHNYCYRSRAVDMAGNMEDWPAGDTGDTCTNVDTSQAPPQPWWDANYSYQRQIVVLNNDTRYWRPDTIFICILTRIPPPQLQHCLLHRNP